MFIIDNTMNTCNLTKSMTFFSDVNIFFSKDHSTLEKDVIFAVDVFR